MATHFGILAWKIPWTEEPGRLQSIGSQRFRYDWATTHACVIDTRYPDVTSICNLGKAWQKRLISAPHDVNSLRLNEEPLQHNSLITPGSWCQLLVLLHVGSCTWWLRIPHSMVVAGFQEWVSAPLPNNRQLHCLGWTSLRSHMEALPPYSKPIHIQRLLHETSLVVQWLRLHAPNAGGPGSTPGQETRSYMLQQKSLHATTKDPTCYNEDRKSHVLQVRPRVAK